MLRNIVSITNREEYLLEKEPIEHSKQRIVYIQLKKACKLPFNFSPNKLFLH